MKINLKMIANVFRTRVGVKFLQFCAECLLRQWTLEQPLFKL